MPEATGRRWWQRNRYMCGGYFVKSDVRIKDVNINTYGLTLGSQTPIQSRSGELLLGVAFDLGIRGTEKNGLLRETFAKIRLNITFKEFWFVKQKIN